MNETTTRHGEGGSNAPSGPGAGKSGDAGSSRPRRSLRRFFPSAGVMVALSLLLAATSIRVADPVWVETLRVKTFDLYQWLSPRPAGTYAVAIVDLDERSLSEVGQWPWPRTVVTKLIDRIAEAGAFAIGFDVVFAEYDRMSPGRVAETLDSLPPDAREALQALPSNEAVMAAAMTKTGVVLGQVGLNTRLPKDRPVTEIASSVRIQAGGDPRPFLTQYVSLLANVPELERAAAGLGIFSLTAEIDGKVRRVPLVARIGQDIRPALTVEMLRVAFGGSSLITRTDEAGMQSVEMQIRRELGGGSFVIPTDSRGRIWVHFSEPARYNTGDFSSRLYLSAADVLAGRVPEERLHGRLVLIGTSAVGLEDIRDTPVASRMPGVEVHANILESIFAGEQAYLQALQAKQQGLLAQGLEPGAAMQQALASVDKHAFFLRYPNYANSAELFVTFLAGLLLMLLIPRLGPAWTLVGLGLAGLGLAGFSWYLYTQRLLLFDATYPGATLLALYAVLTFSNYTREAKERKRVRSAFSQYLSPAVVEQLARHPDQLKLGGETKEMTFLFCDVRGFTSISEGYKSDPQRLTELINRLLTPLSDAILAREGTIDKYMGDCVMAFWNAPMDVADHEAKACTAALDMLRALDALDRELAAGDDETRAPLRVGIGLNTGECVVGNMGSAQRFDYSVLGDAVNLAARLEPHCQDYGVDILLGETTAARVAGRFAFLELDRIAVKGKREAVTIHALLGDEAMRRSQAFTVLAERNAAMLAAYRARDWRAAERLAEECRALPGAPEAVYELYLRRIAECRARPPAPDWNGVFVAVEK